MHTWRSLNTILIRLSTSRPSISWLAGGTSCIVTTWKICMSRETAFLLSSQLPTNAKNWPKRLNILFSVLLPITVCCAFFKNQSPLQKSLRAPDMPQSKTTPHKSILHCLTPSSFPTRKPRTASINLWAWMRDSGLSSSFLSSTKIGMA